MFKMIAFNVGHGNCIYFRTPRNKTYMFDCADAEGFSPVKYIKEVEGVDQLDTLFITHPHTDHIREIHVVDEVLKPKRLSCQSYDWQAVIDQAATKDPPCMLYARDMVKRYVQTTPEDYEDEEIKLTHYYIPTEDVMALSMRNWVNRSSIVTVLQYKAESRTWKFLITGDAPIATLYALCQDANFKEDTRNIDVLIAPHHGGYSGIYYTLLTCMNRPMVSLVTYFDKPDARSLDPIARDIYDNPDFFRGINVDGECKRLIILGRDGSFHLEIDGDTHCGYLL